MGREDWTLMKAHIEIPSLIVLFLMFELQFANFPLESEVSQQTRTLSKFEIDLQ